MTTVADVEKLLARGRRLSAPLRQNTGSGASWEHTFPDRVTERYTIAGIKPVESLEDDVSNFFLWA